MSSRQLVYRKRNTKKRERRWPAKTRLLKWIISVFWLCLIKLGKSIIDMESLYSSRISFHNTLLSVACSILFEQWVR